MRLSRLGQSVGLCQTDVLGHANYLNSAQQRLLYAKEAGDEGWWGTWAEMVFNVSRNSPYLTTPRGVARLESLSVCDNPVNVQNQFYEYLQFGNGRLPKQFKCSDNVGLLQVLSRNNVPTFTDLTNAPQYLVAYLSDSRDVGRRVLLQGLDANQKTIYSLDTQNQVTGIFVALESPSVVSPMTFSEISGIQKDVTYGPVQIFQRDPVSGAEILLLTMEPSEQTAWYRRYYLDTLPCGCCPAPVPSVTSCPAVQVRAIAKLELVPVAVDTDYLLIQNPEALIAECQSIRYADMDQVNAKQMSQERHIAAIRLLNGELNHYLGTNDPAVDFAPFGSARLEYKRVGIMI